MKNDLKTAAFTLVELLVSLAIIAILISLIFPLMKMVVGEARRAQCQGRLRALGGALAAYIGDHEGSFPMAAQTYEGYWYDIISPYMGDKGTKLPSQRAAVPQWLVCPAKPDLLGYGWNQEYFGNHAYRRDWGIEADDAAFSKMVQVTSPARTIILGDSKDAEVQPANDYQHRYIYTKPASPTHRPLVAARHHGGGHYLFCDGHVELLTVDELVKLAPGIFQKVKQ